MGLIVETSVEPPSSAGWDDLVTADRAPLFYRPDVLRAYHHHPLRDVLSAFYLTVRREGGDDPIAVLPVYLQPADDPLGVLAAILPGFRPAGRPLLLSHVWHWYDTHLPAQELTLDVVDAVCGELAQLAAVTGAQGLGFMNVADGSKLAAALRATGQEPQMIDARHVMDLGGFDSVDAYLTSIPAHARQDLRRHARRAAASGARVA